MVGDMNARFGGSVRELPRLLDLANVEELSYLEICDNARVFNDNAELLSTICIDNTLLVVNNVKYQDKHFSGNKTFHRVDVWISMVDTCIASAKIINHVQDFVVLQRDDPSDHAPITVTVAINGVDLNRLLARAERLGGSARASLCRKPASFSKVDSKWFVHSIAHIYPSIIYPSDRDDAVQNIIETIYTCARNNVRRDERAVHSDISNGKWKRLLSDLKEKKSTVCEIY